MPLPAPSPVGPRIAPRHKVFLPAEMIGAGGSTRAHLLNLSTTGALMHADTPPASGATVQLRCGTASWSARVVWAADKRFGVVHVTRLSSVTIDALVAIRPMRLEPV